MTADELCVKPSGYSYRVDQNIWAGEYPMWDWGEAEGVRQLRMYLDFGINYFLDLTIDGEKPPYSTYLPENVQRRTFPIPNNCCPESVELVVELFRTLSNEAINQQGTKLYIHCHGGVGRTGTIVACYYIHFKGLNAEEALAEMRQGFATHGRSKWMSAPESAEQVQFIRDFAATHHLYR